jgi:REP element-mobilizing transposase RayT
MSNTYTQIHIQLIFALQYRMTLIDNIWKNKLYKYITGIIQAQKHKLIVINGVADHVHILIGYRPLQKKTNHFLKLVMSNLMNGTF